MPEAMYVEDWESDESSAVPNSRVHANASTAGRAQKPASRRPQGRDAASDPGTSAHAGLQQTSKGVDVSTSASSSSTLTLRPSLKSSTSQSATTMQRSNSTRNAQRSSMISSPAVESHGCLDPHCRDPRCLSKRNTDRRYTIPNHPPPQPPQKSQYSQVPPTQYTSMGPPPPPTLHSVPRPRSNSTSRARPNSIHGYTMPIHTSYDNSARGPPISNSAYYGYATGNLPPTTPILGSTPPNLMGPYSAISPGALSPTSPVYPASSGLPQYSARTAVPNVPGFDHTRPIPSPRPLVRTISARATYSPEYSDSDSDSFSDSDGPGDDHHRRRQSQVLITQPSSRRPNVPKSYTTSSIPRQSRSREPRPVDYMLRAPYTDNGADYPSDQFDDSLSTSRAIIGRRGTVSSSTRSSRQPSVATTASSGRTKATTLSSMSDVSKVVIEGRNGRRVDYLSKAELTHLLAQQKLDDEQRKVQDKAAAYQSAVGGGEPYELTAENMRQQLKRSSGSHVSGSARSQKSGGSKTSRPDGIKIHSGDTVLHIYGEAKVEMRPSEDGGPAQVFIASNSGRDSGYHTSSKSGSSRKGRSHVSRKDYADDYPRHDR